MTPPLWRRARALAPLLALIIAGCDRSGAAPAATATASADRPAAVQAPRSREQAPQVRDLSIDESMGGHTLARHVGKSDADLSARLRQEPQISAASTYTDRATAERVVASTLASSSAKVDAWQHRSGRRPNLVLYYADRSGRPIGRSLARGHSASSPCDRALVVLRWDERRDRFHVLTSYPEARR